MTRYLYPLLLLLSLTIADLQAQFEKEIIESVSLRNIGPAYMTGRISDIEKDPTNPSTWYVATASGNVWKTTNNGTTWDAIFENYGSYSTGCITIDPRNPNVVWLGTGENQSQRSVGWGDGIYKSLDGGKTWDNKGLQKSEHIGKILIDPRNSDHIIVAAQGPLWKEGGDRGVYRSTDGGESWELTLEISKNTGASDLAFDPKDPGVIYASTYQRRRHVGILVAGGPESRLYKSTDNGKSWKMLTKGLPGGDLGRIAVAVSPQKSNVIYAHISGAENSSGFFRSADYGESWTKTNNYAVVDPQYYGEIYCDPHNFDHVYVVDVMIHVTKDGGNNFERLNSRFKHVDNHEIVFDPHDPDYIMVGCDGGIYESWDKGEKWKYHDNIPIMQFYRVGLDNDYPFYNVYGGTQDNSTLYGPSRTLSRHGITNGDWKLAIGGDGFQARIDPEDPNIVYCQSQYAGIVRYNKATGSRTELQPQISIEEDPLRWHWDSPLIISPHNPKRLYYAAQRVFKSDDRGDTWVPISGDLSRNEDRNQREVMGKIWPPEAVWKNVFTSPFGTIVSLSESTLKEGLIVAGTDDGQIQITEDGGENWTKINQFPGIPDRAYVADIFTSLHDAQTIYAVFNNHKEGDFNPYILKSTDLGKTWKSIANGINAPHATWTIYEDHKDPNLLFAGTEFGLFATVDGGDQWYQMKAKLPTIPVRDLEIQQREDDLVAATFGRGMWILDDINILRTLVNNDSPTTKLFPVARSWTFLVKGDMGYSTKGVFGDNFYSASNVGPGPVVNFYQKKSIPNLKAERKANEKTGISKYTSYDQLKAEDTDSEIKLFALLKDENGNVMSSTPLKNQPGLQTITTNLSKEIYSDDGEQRVSGPPLLKGKFTVQAFKSYAGKTEAISGIENIEIEPLPNSLETPSKDYTEFYTNLAHTMANLRSVQSQIEKKQVEIENKLVKALSGANDAEVLDLEEKRKMLLDMEYKIQGNQTKRKRFQYFHPGISRQLSRAYHNMYSSYHITNTHREISRIAKQELRSIMVALAQM